MNARRTRGRNALAGFTLIEALIAMALMGMIVSSLAAISAQWLPNWNRGVIRIQRNEQIALGLERLSADFSAAEFIAPHRETRQPIFDGTEHSIIFVRTAIGPDAGPGLDVVRIAEISSERGPMLVRARALFTPVTDADRNQKELPGFVDPVVLLRPPFRVSFSYAGADRLWRETWSNANELPRAIKFTVRDATGRQALAFSTSTAVHREIPGDCIIAKTLADCRQLRPGQSQPTENGK